MKFSEVLPMADQQPPLEKKRITPLLLYSGSSDG